MSRTEPARPARPCSSTRTHRPAPGFGAAAAAAPSPVARPRAVGALALEVGKDLAQPVAAALVANDALGDGVLRPGQRRDRRVLERRENPSAEGVAEQGGPGDHLGVPDDEPEPP